MSFRPIGEKLRAFIERRVLVVSKPMHLCLLRVFDINACPTCGQHKRYKTCFCKTCYFALPEKLRSGLYVSAMDGDEFYDNYLAAMDHLINIDMAVSPNMWPPNAKRMLQETGLQQAMETVEEEAHLSNFSQIIFFLDR